ncbi:sodium:solute symporter family transporter [Granulicella paludicola]|uniref:sodium:solute symporter family transporter n=1 Tax=Granulicella paludicola TaxID=474951 RepID=UPI0021DFCFA4|nr:sodium/solute symporter [Granulicella paludicola]
MATHLHTVDLVIVALYLIGITIFGLRFAKRGGKKADKSLKSYFLADNTIPWWAIALSIVSAETSTLTIISIPGVAFAGDFGFLQVVLGYMLGRIVVAALFLPRYFAGEMLTAYQLIDQRFGHTLHKVTAGLFLLTRAAAEGVRVFAVSIVVGIAIGTGDILSIGIISALTLLYTFEGGMAAVIWTDVVQMGIYIFGTLVAVWSLGHHIPGGWSTIHQVAGAAGKFHLFNFALNLTTTYTFWAGVLGGTFLTMASHGTDQLMVQRMLAARNLRESRLALLSSGVVIFIQFALFLLIGAGLYVFYGLHPEHFASSDRIFPTFIVHELPLGIAGLLVAAILAAAMSNLSAALNSLSSTTVVDFYMSLRPNADDRERSIISRSSTVLWAIVLFAIAIYSLSVGGKGHVVEIGLSIASVAYGCLLGVFLLGTLTKFATEIGTAIGMVCGFALNLWLWQGTFPLHLGSLIIPHIAFTWYVLIGALVTFAIGSLFSLIFRKQSARKSATALLALAITTVILSGASRPCDAQSKNPEGLHPTQIAQTLSATNHTPSDPWTLAPEPSHPAYDFSPISALLNDAITNHHLPGAVVVVGHNGQVVFHQAYGSRKLAGEPGLDGQPSPAEPMTEDTIFDMASLTKDLATATGVMQLYEQGKIASFDDPVEKYLPGFNTTHDARRAKVTLRMLLTHTSGEAPDVSLKDPWGLAAPDKAEGIHRALTTPLKDAPGSIFVYSDINFILLGDLIETLSGQTEDIYASEHIFKPLGMTDTRYLPLAKACGPHKIIGAAIAWAPATPGRIGMVCLPGTWSTSLLPRIAPTTHDDESKSDPAANPHFDMLTRGTVHDPTTRRMGGVAGHAGVFSTAHDISLYASALLEKLVHNTGPFPLQQSTLQLMTQPEQPGHDLQQLYNANKAQAAAITAGDKPAEPGLAPHYPAIRGQDLRGYGWDIDTAFSKPRGMIFPIGSFGHTGYTGTTLWMDPYSDSYVVLLTNAVHPRGNTPISNLRGQVATAAASALGLSFGTQEPVILSEARSAQSKDLEKAAPATVAHTISTTDPVACSQPNTFCDPTKIPNVRTGIDVLESTHFAALASFHHIGLLTNQTGIDSNGKRTIDVLVTSHLPLVTLFTPEHGITGAMDKDGITSTTDPATGLPAISLYGAKPADRHPTHDQLKDLDAVVIDLQDAGVHFWTYEAATGYFIEAAALEKSQYHHDLHIILLDRPNLVGGLATRGPVSDPGSESYTDYMPMPSRHGLTMGELMQYANATKHLDASLTVIPMQHWQRAQYFDDTGLPWINPSPNLRSPQAAIVYPCLGLIETTNISVGRGTATPFLQFGAPWMKATDVAAALTARHIPGIAFEPITIPVAEDANHYPFHGQTIDAVHLNVTDAATLDTPELAMEILTVLHKLYPTQFQLQKARHFIDNQATFDALMRGDDPRAIATSWQPSLDAFRAATRPYLLYE